MLDCLKSNVESESLVSLLQVYAESFLYEPGVDDLIWPRDEYYLPSDYISGSSPTKLSVYNAEFKSLQYTTIDRRQRLTKCRASMNFDGHVILLGASSTKCVECGKIICNMSSNILPKNNNNRIVCMDYYCHQITDSSDNFDYSWLKDTVKTHEEMIDELKECGWVINAANISNIEVVDLYDTFITKKTS